MVNFKLKFVDEVGNSTEKDLVGLENPVTDELEHEGVTWTAILYEAFKFCENCGYVISEKNRKAFLDFLEESSSNFSIEVEEYLKSCEPKKADSGDDEEIKLASEICDCERNEKRKQNRKQKNKSFKQNHSYTREKQTQTWSKEQLQRLNRLFANH